MGAIVVRVIRLLRAASSVRPSSGRNAVIPTLALALLAGCDAAAPPTVAPSPTMPVLAIAPELVAQLREPWRPTPFELPADAIAAIDRACGGASDFEEGLRLVVVDARGEGLVQAYYARPDGLSVTCNDMSVAFDGVIEQGWGTGSAPGVALPDVGSSGLAVVHHTALGDQPHSASHVGGVAGSAIARVEVHRQDAPPIVASLSNGWFAAWVIGDFGRATIRGFDAAGTEISVIDL